MTTDRTKRFFRVSAEDFKKIPGSPIAYWLSARMVKIFAESPTVSKEMITREGMATSNNDLFMRLWSEVSIENISFDSKPYQEESKLLKRWYPYNKGGSFRRWYGNDFFVVDWQNGGKRIKQSIDPCTGRIRSHNYNGKYAFQAGITWSAISSGTFSARKTKEGFLFDSKGAKGFTSRLDFYLALLNSITSNNFLKVLAPTLDYKVGDIIEIPVCGKDTEEGISTLSAKLVMLSQADWDSYETSWDFLENPLIRERRIWDESNVEVSSLSEIYSCLRLDWKRQTEEMRRLEIENNRIFIKAYGLQDELSPEVPWNEITLTCNPWYRYGKKPEDADSLGNSFYLNASAAQIHPISKQEESCPDEDFPFAHDTEQRLLEDTIKEYISYAVGCMMGRYSPEKPGLILANQPISGQDDEIEYQTAITGSNIFGELGVTRYFTIKNGKRKITSYSDFYDVFGDEGNYHQFMDRDGVLPILDEEWFLDDIVAQFKAFLQFTFGAEHFADNLDFIEKALGKDIRKYFIKDFYKDHVQRYKKRPIYWMFSSPKGSFNALIYMHRYRPDTVSIVLNEYLREFISKIRSHREHLITENNRATLAPAEKTRNLKLIDKYAAMLTELDTYERDILYPLAQQKIAIDLDDGVKVNYCKFGAALKKIPGLEAKEE